MPEPRPLASALWHGGYDEPPASTETSTPQSRSSLLRRAIRGTNELARDQMTSRSDWYPTNPSDTRPALSDPRLEPRRRTIMPSTRRRPRSESTHEDDFGEAEGRRSRRYKRRRIEPSPPLTPKRATKYGHYGQVEPGRLQLELISCDGGEHRDPRYPATSLGAENLLRHDKSVYCSERPYCNIVLRHSDDTPFCLEKLHIVGPEHGFTAPVREGLVYVAMTMSDMQKYMDTKPPHARRSGIDSPPIRRLRDRSIRSSPERITLADALRDPQVTAALDNDADSAYDWERNRTTRRTRGAEHENYYGVDFGFGRIDPEAHCEIPPFSDPSTLPSSSDTRPVTLLSDEEPGPEDISTQDVLDYRLDRLRMMRRRFDMENWDRDDRWANLPADPTDRDLNRLMARSRVRDDSATPAPPPEDETPSTFTQTQILDQAEVAHDKNVTCARFQIKRGKYKVAIKFDPPVSGRFILLKVWANRSNVDLQSVIAKGFGGCRFFPARSVR